METSSCLRVPRSDVRESNVVPPSLPKTSCDEHRAINEGRRVTIDRLRHSDGRSQTAVQKERLLWGGRRRGKDSGRDAEEAPRLARGNNNSLGTMRIARPPLRACMKTPAHCGRRCVLGLSRLTDKRFMQIAEVVPSPNTRAARLDAETKTAGLPVGIKLGPGYALHKPATTIVCAPCRPASLLTCLLLITLLYHNQDHIPERLKPAVDSISSIWHPKASAEEMVNNVVPVEPLQHETVDPNDPSTAGQPTKQPGHVSTSSAKPLPDAHRLTSPDEFAGHFDALAALEGISVTEAKRTCSWTPDQLNGLQFTWGPDRLWMKDGDVVMSETEDRRKQWINFYRTGLAPWESSKSRFKGRGIVTAAGNQGTLKRLTILLRQLGRLGSKLPVEVHHWTEEEIPEAERTRLRSVYPDITFNDLSAEHNVYHTKPPPFFYGHFNLKTAAVVNSRFEEVLMLDSDIIPLVAPDDLFDTPTYKEFGTVFWPDMARTRPENPMWAITNTYCRMDEYEQESGQLLVDKRKFFYHLQLAAWLNEDQYYRDMLLGDKDMFRFAWHAMRTKHGRPSRWLTSFGVLHDLAGGAQKYCGHTYAQHHPNGSIAFLHQGGLKTLVPNVMKHFHESGGLYNAFKRSPHDRDWRWPEKTSYSFDSDPHIAGAPGWACMNLDDVQPTPVDELLPNLEQFIGDLGGFWEFENLAPGEGNDHV
ncbi:hypothetical protein FH972_023467 [Carpinus fangiana]|uniref:Glycosyltransferase family 71 protein n=1 Tax=Carpinus fangiana TaxID=176857 RepID=A0A5N6KXJ7_9ROSI|nr:hypothetical protein FH972_023467 [Carpinus fangiana]